MTIIRTVSPHLSIYKPQHNSIFSIFNRITGVVLSILLFSFVVINVITADLLSFSSIMYKLYVLYTINFTLMLDFIFFIGLASFLYHVIMHLDDVDFVNMRPAQLEEVDQYDLKQFAGLFFYKVLLLIVVFTFLILL